MEWSRCLVTWTPSPTHQHCQRHFYRRFLPGAANIHCPLTEALKGNPKVLSWTAEMQAPTTAIKAVLVAAVPVSHPLPATQLSLATDASDSHISGVLQQREVGGALSLLVSTVESCLKQSAGTLLLTGNCWQPSTPSGIFMIMLEGCHFQLWTDHKLLLAALHRVTQPWTPRQKQQLAFIAECTNDVLHVPGLSNMVAHHLLHPPAAPACQMATHQSPPALKCHAAHTHF